MTHFADELEAKRFAVELILSQAEKDGIHLSVLERDMLYFSATQPILPNIAEAAHEFENECDSEQYEKKISTLTNRLQKRLRSDDRQTLNAWADALRKLSEGDHYLLVLARSSASPQRLPRDFLKLCMAALIVIMAGGGLMALLPEHPAWQPARERWAFYMWLVVALAASVYFLLLQMVGRQRARDVIRSLM